MRLGFLFRYPRCFFALGRLQFVVRVLRNYPAAHYKWQHLRGRHLKKDDVPIRGGRRGRSHV